MLRFDTHKDIRYHKRNQTGVVPATDVDYQQLPLLLLQMVPAPSTTLTETNSTIRSHRENLRGSPPSDLCPDVLPQHLVVISPTIQRLIDPRRDRSHTSRTEPYRVCTRWRNGWCLCTDRMMSASASTGLWGFGRLGRGHGTGCRRPRSEASLCVAPVDQHTPPEVRDRLTDEPDHRALAHVASGCWRFPPSLPAWLQIPTPGSARLLLSVRLPRRHVFSPGFHGR